VFDQALDYTLSPPPLIPSIQGATISIPTDVALQTINRPIVGAMKSPSSAFLVPAKTW